MNENNPGAMDMTVKVFPVQSSKNLLATASVTLSGCFAVCGIQIRDGTKRHLRVDATAKGREGRIP